jgi:glycosyltransferase involved in cell wall biosynthesis
MVGLRAPGYALPMAEVAIIMAARNEEKYIERALRSCVGQRLDPGSCEVIVVDDGSTDATARIAAEFDGVTVLSNDAQLGLPASLNRGIRAAHSRFVVRVDADDYIHQDFVRVLTLFLELNGHMEAVACDYYTVDGREQHLEHVNCLERPIGCGILFRKDRLTELGLYDESFLMAEDLDLRLRFEKRWPMHRVELPLYRYRLHGENMTSDRDSYDEHLNRAVAKNADGHAA